MSYAYLFSMDSKYQPEGTALLNSLELIGNINDVYVLGYKLPEEFTSQFSKLSYKVTLINISEQEAREFGGEGEILCRKRYWYLAEIGKNYKSVCLLDADMCFVRDPSQQFQIAAECNFILGVSLEQKSVYGVHEHQKVRGQHVIQPTWNPKDMCCTPMFINARMYEKELKEAWDIFTDGYPHSNFKAPDQQALNQVLLSRELTNNIYLLPNMCWVGSNEKMLKPYTRVTCQQDNLFWTESGEPIYIIHGRFYTKKWRDCQLSNRHGCAEGYLGFSFKSDQMAEGAMNCLYEYFKKCLNYKIQIDTTKAYTNDGYPDHTLEERGEVLV